MSLLLLFQPSVVLNVTTTARATASIATVGIEIDMLANAPTATASSTGEIIEIDLFPPVAGATGSAPTSTIILSPLVLPPAGAATGSAPLPIWVITMSPLASSAAANAPPPTFSISPLVLPPAASATASAPTPAVEIDMLPGAASATASAPTPIVAITMLPGASSATASAPTPVLHVDCILSAPAPAATASAPTPTPVITLLPPAPGATGQMGFFGNNFTSTSGGSVNADTKNVFKFTLLDAATVSAIVARLRYNGIANQDLRAFIYAYNSGTNKPGALLASAVVTITSATSSDTWISFTLATPLILAAGSYCLGIQGGTTNNGARWAIAPTASAPVITEVADTYADGLDDPWVSGFTTFGAAQTGIIKSIYAQYQGATPKIDMLPAAPSATASAPTPTIHADCILSAPAATATGSVPTPSVAITILPGAAGATSSAPVGTVVETILPGAGLATASAPAPSLVLSQTMLPPAAAATATAPAPTVSIDSSLTVNAPAASAIASAPIPTLSNSSGATLPDLIVGHLITIDAKTIHIQTDGSLLLVNNRVRVQVSPGIYL